MVVRRMNQLHAECPECGHSETFGLTPTISLGVSLEATVTVTNCAECGYTNE